MTSSNLTLSSEDSTPSQEGLVTCLTLYVLTLLLGLPANAAIVYVIVSHRSLRIAVNAYIANMAALDLLACTLLVPLRMLFYLAQSSMERDGIALCKVEVFFHGLVDAGRMLFLAAISFERYQAVANPFRRDKAAAARRAFLTLGVLWALMIVYASLLAVFFYDTIMFEFCMKNSSAQPWDYELWGGIERFLVLPLSVVIVIVVTVCYVLMVRLLHSHRTKMLGHARTASNKVAPLTDSVVKAQGQPPTVQTNNDNPSGRASIPNVTTASAGTTNITSVGVVSTTVMTVDPRRLLTSQASSPGSSLQPDTAVGDSTDHGHCDDGTGPNDTTPPTAASLSETVSENGGGQRATKDGESTVSSSTHVLSSANNENGAASKALSSMTMPDLSSPHTGTVEIEGTSLRQDTTQRQVNSSGQRNAATVGSDIGCDDTAHSDMANIGCSQHSVAAGKSLDCAPAEPSDLTKQCPAGIDNTLLTAGVFFQLNGASAAIDNSGKGLNPSSISCEHTGHDETLQSFPFISQEDNEDSMRQEDTVRVTHTDKAITFSSKSSLSTQCPDKLSLTTGIHSLTTLTPVISPLDIPKNVSTTQQAVQGEKLMGTVDSSPALDSTLSTQLQVSPEMPTTGEVSPEMHTRGDVSPKVSTTAEVSPVMPTTAELSPPMPTTAEVSPEMPTTAEVSPEMPTTAEIRPDIPTTDEATSTPTVDTEHIAAVTSQTVVPTHVHSPDISMATEQTIVPPSAHIPDTSAADKTVVPGDTVTSTKVVKVVEMDGTAHVEPVESSLKIQGDVCMFTPKNRVQGRRKVEGRVAKRLVVIFLTFLLLWLPYPVAVLTLHLIYMQPYASSSSSSSSAGTFSVSQTVTDVSAVLSALSMVTAAVNPIFYGLTNVTIRSELLTAMRGVCRYCSRRCSRS